MRRWLWLLAFFLPAAHGAGTTATVSWVAPTTYTNGVALPLHDIDHFNIVAIDQISGAVNNFTAPVNATSQVITLLCSSFQIQVQAVTTASAFYPNALSGYSNIVTYNTNIQCVPNPPTNVTAS